MKRKLCALMVIMMIISLLAGCKNEKGLSMGAKLEDFEYMYKIINENYPLFEINKTENNVDWIRKKEQFIDRIKETKSDQEYFKVLDEILSELNDIDTEMMKADKYNRWVVQMKNTEYKPGMLVYDELTKPVSVERYKKMTEENIELENKEKVEIGSIRNNLDSPELRSEILEEDKVAYLGINSFGRSSNPTDASKINKFINDFYEEIRDYDTLIIDIRGASGWTKVIWKDFLVPILIKEEMITNKYEFYRGGQFTYASMRAKESLLSKVMEIDKLDREKVTNIPSYVFRDFKYFITEQLTIKPKKGMGFEGEIFLLVDNDVKYSAEDFALFAKETGFATILGENTGGGAIRPRYSACSLPKSGYVFTFIMTMMGTTDGSCLNEFTVKPDIEFSSTKVEDLNEDKAIQKVLEIINKN